MVHEFARRGGSGEGAWPWDEMELMLEHTFSLTKAEGKRCWRPPLDLLDEEDAFVVLIELPGIDPDNVDVSVHGRSLTIRGNRRAPGRDQIARCLLSERCHGPFERRILLPSSVDPQKVTAEYDNGILTVRILKSGLA